MSNPLPKPGAAATPVSAYDLQACTALMRGGSKSFFAASKLLPVRLRAPATALYAYCRLADDAIDLGADPTRFTKAAPARRTQTAPWPTWCTTTAWRAACSTRS